MDARSMTLFYYHLPVRFVLADRKHIGKHKAFYFRRSVLLMPLMWLWQLLWTLWHIRKADRVYIWFADYHAVIPVWVARRFNKPVFLCLGGYDADCLPEIGYGVFIDPLRAPMAKYSIRNATMLIVLSDRMIDTLRRWVVFEVPFTVIYWDVDTDFWTPGPLYRLAAAMSVSTDMRYTTRYRKGVEGEVPFRVFSGLTREELREQYRRHKVFVQISRVEGLPNALCEAMACGCVPVVTDVAGMPEIVEGVGVVCERENVEEAIEQALTMSGVAARQRILDTMTNQRRRKILAAFAWASHHR